MPDYVVVGAGLAGASAAIALRESSADHRVLLIGAETDAPYERPALSKGYLKGSVTFGKLLVRPPAFYADRRIETMFGSPVARVDAASRVVQFADGHAVEFDSLLIATGATNRRPPIPGIDLDGVISLRTVRDADRLRARMQSARKAVVVGMGFIGCEVTASLRHAGLDVTAIDPGPAPLAHVLGDAVGHTLSMLHRTHGVRTIFNDRVEVFEGADRVERVITKDGLSVACDLAVVGIGVEPAVNVVRGSGIALDNGIVVNEYCASNVHGIYAAGDVANHYHPVFDRRIRVEHWQNARRQGVNAARNMAGQRVPFDDIPWFWSDQYDANIQYAGHHTTYDELVIRGHLGGGSYAAFYMNGGLLDAVVSINNARDVRRAMPLIRSRQPVDTAKLRDEGVDLRSLLATA
jgi:3-phenylpropionate/trans-cinnamate dioxygenase ferredoxin reductase subunit